METINYKRKFDKEYRTEYLDEVKFLNTRGIRYTYVKDEDGISVYKYEKTIDLFEALVEFYKGY